MTATPVTCPTCAGFGKVHANVAASACGAPAERARLLGILERVYDAHASYIQDWTPDLLEDIRAALHARGSD